VQALLVYEVFGIDGQTTKHRRTCKAPRPQLEQILRKVTPPFFHFVPQYAMAALKALLASRTKMENNYVAVIGDEVSRLFISLLNRN
jgi:hypothetical protein